MNKNIFQIKIKLESIYFCDQVFFIKIEFVNEIYFPKKILVLNKAKNLEK